MKSEFLHRWDLSPKMAIAQQEKLREQIIIKDVFGPVSHVAGVDVGFENHGKVTRAAVVILDYPSLKQVEQSVVRSPTRFPYIPGLLSFREIPALLKAFKKINRIPDLILCDGQGIAHPRNFGIACHLGLILDLPTIGVAKSRLVGVHDRVPEKKGCWRPLIYKERTIGAVLRTRKGIKPVYVSPGHMVCLQSAIEYVLNCTTRFRLPETTRVAHKLASL